MARLSASIGLLASLALPGSAAGDETPETFFELKIRPVLATNCLPCHGGKKTSSGLKVDSRESLLRGGDRGPAIVAGRARKEPSDPGRPPGRRRPEDAAGETPWLRRVDRGAFAEWIAAGQPGRKRSPSSPTRRDAASRHWAFQKVKSVAPPRDPSGLVDALRSTASSRPGAVRRGSRRSGGRIAEP